MAYKIPHVPTDNALLKYEVRQLAATRVKVLEAPCTFTLHLDDPDAPGIEVARGSRPRWLTCGGNPIRSVYITIAEADTVAGEYIRLWASSDRDMVDGEIDPLARWVAQVVLVPARVTAHMFNLLQPAQNNVTAATLYTGSSGISSGTNAAGVVYTSIGIGANATDWDGAHVRRDSSSLSGLIGLLFSESVSRAAKRQLPSFRMTGTIYCSTQVSANGRSVYGVGFGSHTSWQGALDGYAMAGIGLFARVSAGGVGTWHAGILAEDSAFDGDSWPRADAKIVWEDTGVAFAAGEYLSYAVEFGQENGIPYAQWEINGEVVHRFSGSFDAATLAVNANEWGECIFTARKLPADYTYINIVGHWSVHRRDAA